MEDMVNVNLKDYLELVDFKREIEAGKIIVSLPNFNCYDSNQFSMYRDYTRHFIAKENVIKQLKELQEKRNKELEAIIEDYKNTISDFVHDMDNKVNEQLSCFKKMSIFKFMKWKKENKEK